MLAACGGGQGGDSAQPDSVGIALEQYSPTLFDTITWTADSAALSRGAVVWSFSCKKCHGDLGTGGAHFVSQKKDPVTDAMVPDTIRTPDFTAPGWRFATDKEGLIKYIYSGNDKQMPHWGISGLKPRDIDAVATYVQKVLVVGGAKPDSTAAADTAAPQ